MKVELNLKIGVMDMILILNGLPPDSSDEEKSKALTNLLKSYLATDEGLRQISSMIIQYKYGFSLKQDGSTVDIEYTGSTPVQIHMPDQIDIKPHE